MIIQSRRVLYNNQLQPAQVEISEDGVIQSINLSYDPRLWSETAEVG